MPKTTPIILDDDLAGFVNRQVADGHYASTDEVVRAGLRLLEECETDIDALRSALIEGEQSGPSLPFDFNAFLAEMRDRRAG